MCEVPYFQTCKRSSENDCGSGTLFVAIKTWLKDTLNNLCLSKTGSGTSALRQTGSTDVRRALSGPWTFDLEAIPIDILRHFQVNLPPSVLVHSLVNPFVFVAVEVRVSIYLSSQDAQHVVGSLIREVCGPKFGGLVLGFMMPLSKPPNAWWKAPDEM